MGIRDLNRYLLKTCTTAIRYTPLHELRGKTIAIDTNNYLYQFAFENALIENVAILIDTFLQYNITPVFVFDGKPPQEKMELLKLRRKMKHEAEEKYNHLLQTDPENAEELNQYRQQFTRITQVQIQSIQKYIQTRGLICIDAPNESDQICVYLVNSGKCWACMSQDMDMFVYGCRRVIRKFNQDYILYDFEKILQELGMTEREFRQISVLSGTDYNISGTTNLKQTLYYYRIYSKKYRTGTGNRGDFYEWLWRNTKYIDNYDQLKNCCSIFERLLIPMHLRNLTITAV